MRILCECPKVIYMQHWNYKAGIAAGIHQQASAARQFMEILMKDTLALIYTVMLIARRISVEFLTTHPGSIGEKAFYLATCILFRSSMTSAYNAEILEQVSQ
jgi:hypothetical protein